MSCRKLKNPTGLSGLVSNRMTELQHIKIVMNAFAIRSGLDITEPETKSYLIINYLPEQDILAMIQMFESTFGLIISPKEKMKRLHEIKWVL